MKTLATAAGQAPPPRLPHSRHRQPWSSARLRFPSCSPTPSSPLPTTRPPRPALPPPPWPAAAPPGRGGSVGTTRKSAGDRRREVGGQGELTRSGSVRHRRTSSPLVSPASSSQCICLLSHLSLSLFLSLHRSDRRKEEGNLDHGHGRRGTAPRVVFVSMDGGAT